jgi:phage terminase small subunit
MARAHPLTAKQQRFVQEYLVDLNATQAAVRAGYSPKTGREIASRMLTNVNIQAALSEAIAARVQRTEITQDRVLREIALLAHSDIRDYTIDDQGNMGLRAGAHPDATRAIASLKKKILHTDAGTLYETEIRLWNKPASVRMAAEHLGLLLPAQTAGTTTVNVLVH